MKKKLLLMVNAMVKERTATKKRNMTFPGQSSDASNKEISSYDTYQGEKTLYVFLFFRKVQKKDMALSGQWSDGGEKESRKKRFVYIPGTPCPKTAFEAEI